MDEELYDIGKWAVKSIQAIGYMPVTFKKKSGFKFCLCSCAVLCSLLLTLGSVLWTAKFFVDRTRYASLTRIYGETELFAQTFLVIGISLTGIVTRTLSFFQVRSTLTFWTSTVSMLQRSVNPFGRTPALHKGTYSHLFAQIQKDLRTCALIYFVPTVVHVVGLHGYFLVETLTHDDWLEEAELWLGTGFWFCLACFHTAQSLWLLFFLKIYTALFKIVASDMRGDAGKKCWEDSLSQEGKYKQKAIVYFGEMQLQSGKIAMLEHRLRHGMEMFQSVKSEVKKFNAHFASTLILELINCIVGLLVFLFFTILWIGRGLPQNAAPLAVPMFVYALEVYRLGTAAGLVTKAAKEVLRVIQAQPLHLLSLELQLKVELFTTSIWTNPPIVTAGHFFNLNRGLITSILSSMTTFLIVLVQFKESDDDGNTLNAMARRPSNFTRFRNFSRQHFWKQEKI